jgi:hypothetical protein
MQNQLGYVPGERLDLYPCLACTGLGAVAVRVPPEACENCRPTGIDPSADKLCAACGGRGWTDSRLGIQRITDKEIEVEVLRVNQRFTDAALRQDRAVLLRLIADDYIGTARNGGTIDKTRLLSAWLAPSNRVTSITEDEVHVRLCSDAAVITGSINNNCNQP